MSNEKVEVGILFSDGVITEVIAPKNPHDYLDFFYKKLDVRMIDIVAFEIGGTLIELTCDDEGLFVSGSPVYHYAEGVNIAGNVMITKGVGYDGKTLFFDSMDDHDRIDEVIRYLMDVRKIGTVK